MSKPPLQPNFLDATLRAELKAWLAEHPELRALVKAFPPYCRVRLAGYYVVGQRIDCTAEVYGYRPGEHIFDVAKLLLLESTKAWSLGYVDVTRCDLVHAEKVTRADIEGILGELP